MILSERGAIASAIADGGFHLYPAGKLINMIKKALPHDDLTGDFDPVITPQKIETVKGPDEDQAHSVFKRDIELLCNRLGEMTSEYGIESAFDKMMQACGAMAKRYYGLGDFAAPRPVVVEYFFEGFSDVYKDGDWFAFNVDPTESVELGVPIGTYFKRNQVSPGLPEFSAFHEANHAMQYLTYQHPGVHHYVPWMDEGLADIFGRIMLFRSTGDESLITKIKTFKSEVEIMDPRKVTYHYGEETVALMLLRGRLPFVRALMEARKREPYWIDWNVLAAKMKLGWDPHIALVTAYKGTKPDQFRKKMERDELKFRKEADLDQQDLRIIGMFLASQSPSTLNVSEYAAALWIDEEVKKQPDAGIKIQIRAEDVPQEHKDSVEKLAAKYFILRRQIDDATVYEPYGGGLPYRLGSGEIRCEY